MTHRCESCGAPFAARRRDARFCSDRCRKRARRRGVRLAAVPVTHVDRELVAATHRELVAAGRVDTALGAMALQLARRIEAPGESGSGMAALSKELRAVMADVVKDAATGPDPLDELRARRDA